MVSENALRVSSRTVVSSCSFMTCGRYPTFVSLGMETVPLVGCCMPLMIFSSVDFPAPFFPTSAIRSRSLMTNETLSYSGRALNSTCRFSIDIIGLYGRLLSCLLVRPRWLHCLRGCHFMPRLLSASEYLAAFFRCSSYVTAKLCVPEKSSLAHMYM